MKKKIIVSVVVLVIIGVSAYLVWGRKDSSQEYVTTISQKQKLIQTVSETGKIESPRKVSLSFSSPGELTIKNVEVGNVVEKGDNLAELDHGTLDKKKRKAESDLEVAKANLANVLAGAKQETIKVSQAQVSQAKDNYNSAQEELEKTKATTAEEIQQAKQRLDDLLSPGIDSSTSYEQAVHDTKSNLENIKKEYQQNIDNQQESSLVVMNAKIPVANTALDQVDEVLDDDNIQGIYSAKSSKYKKYTENNYDDSLKLREIAITSLTKAEESDTKNNIFDALSKNIEYLKRVAITLNYCYKGLENTVTSANFTQTQLNSHKTNINTQITAVNTAIDVLESSKRALNTAYLNYDTNVSTAENQLEEAKTNLNEAIRNARDTLSTTRLQGEQSITLAEAKVKNAKKSWDVAKTRSQEVSAGATQEETNLAQAKISQAEARVEMVEEKISGYLLKTPVQGKVVDFKYEIGEQVSAGSPVTSVLGNNDYEIKVDVSEVDIAKVEEGDVAKITLDAFGKDEKFTGKVFFIDSDQTVIQDVVYYEVKLKLIKPDKDRVKRIKPGMTANVFITTEEKEDVLTILGRAIIEKQNEQGRTSKSVRILKEDGSTQDKQVETGLRGDRGMVEVTNGLESGEEVITYVKE